jgi:hypothetical protein
MFPLLHREEVNKPPAILVTNTLTIGHVINKQRPTLALAKTRYNVACDDRLAQANLIGDQEAARPCNVLQGSASDFDRCLLKAL